MCFVDSGLRCWDPTTQAASDDAPSQRRGWRGVLSSSFEVGMRQGRVTLPCKSLRESVRLTPGKGRPPPQPMRPPEFQPRNAVSNHRLRVHIHHPHHPDRAGPTHPLTGAEWGNTNGNNYFSGKPGHQGGAPECVLATRQPASHPPPTPSPRAGRTPGLDSRPVISCISPHPCPPTSAGPHTQSPPSPPRRMLCPVKEGERKGPHTPNFHPPATTEDPKYLIPFDHTKIGKACGNSAKYAERFPQSYEAGEYRSAGYDFASFTPGHLHHANTTSPSYAQPGSGSSTGGMGKSKGRKQPSPQEVASAVAPPLKRDLPPSHLLNDPFSPHNCPPPLTQTPQPLQQPSQTLLPVSSRNPTASSPLASLPLSTHVAQCP